MKIVKFNDDSYAIRRWFFGYEYKDLIATSVDYWWAIDDSLFSDCKTTNLKKVKKLFKTKPWKDFKENKYGVPIK